MSTSTKQPHMIEYEEEEEYIVMTADDFDYTYTYDPYYFPMDSGEHPPPGYGILSRPTMTHVKKTYKEVLIMHVAPHAQKQ